MDPVSNDNEGVVSLNEPTMLTFPNLMEAKAVMKNGKPTGEPKFSSNFEFEPTAADLSALKAKALEVAKAKWPGRQFGKEAAKVDDNGNAKMPTFMFPFSSGTELADKAKGKGKDREFSRGKAVLTARSKYEPRLSVIEGGKLVEKEGDARKAAARMFYSGCLCLAQFNFVAYDGVGQNPDGVTAYLNMVCSLNKGDRLTGGASAAEVFKGYVGTTSAEDPTQGMQSALDDEIGF